jgi:2-phosphosulfolactate phosphatase
MSTTNGTRAFGLGHESARVIACAFTNLSAVATEVGSAGDLVVLCAGREGRFSLCDALCAGHLISRVHADSKQARVLNDAALAARALAARKPSARVLGGTVGGRALTEIGLGADLEVCAEVDRHDFVAEMVDQAITRSGA